MSTFGDVTHDHPDEQDLPAPGTGPEPETTPAGEQPEAEPGGPDGEPVPGTLRAMIPVAKLAAHPGNVRRDLDLSAEFIESVRANGVLVALRITPDGDGYRVIDGGRRLAAAVKAGVDEVPYDLVSERAGDEAGQYLDMINMNRHRNPLTALEEADALFAAKQAGAPKTRIRKATGLTSAGLSNALSAAKLSEEARARVAELDEQLTLDKLAVMAEFDGDEDALARLAIAASCGTLEHEAELLRQARAEQAEQDRLRGELEAAGYTITDILPANGQHLGVLSHDGEDLTPEAHAACPGRGVFFRFYAPLDPVHYCANPDMYGHTFRFRPAASGAAADPGRPSPEPANRTRSRPPPGGPGQPGMAGRRHGPPPVAGHPPVRPAHRTARGRPVRDPAAAGHARAAAVWPGPGPPPEKLRRDHRPRGQRLAGDVRHRAGEPAAAGDARPHRHRLRARDDRERRPQHLAHRPLQSLPARRSRQLPERSWPASATSWPASSRPSPA